MKILLTGANGYLGKTLASHLLQRGHHLVALCRSAPHTHPLPANLQWVQWSLGSDVDLSVARDYDCAVHGAHDFSLTAGQLNIDGTKELYFHLRELGVRRQLFISSYSARPDSTSLYGQIKYTLEQFFIAQGATVVRPGLVIGYGGLFGRNVDRLLRSPLVPLLDGGRDLVPMIAQSDFVEAMTKILEEERIGAYNLFNPDLIAMRDLIQILLRAAGRKALYLPIPVSVAIALLSAARTLGLRLPVDIGNLRALKANQVAIHKSDLLSLIVSPRSPLVMLADTVLQRQRR